MTTKQPFQGSTIIIRGDILSVVLVLVPMLVLVPLFGGYLTVHQVAPVLYTVLAAVFLWIGSRTYLKFQVSGR